jgi:hypothetical protein
MLRCGKTLVWALFVAASLPSASLVTAQTAIPSSSLVRPCTAKERNQLAKPEVHKNGCQLLIHIAEVGLPVVRHVGST